VQNLLGENKELAFEEVLLRSQTKGTKVSLSLKYDF